MNPRRPIFAGDPSDVLGRHRGLFEASPLQRMTSIAAPLGLLAFTVFAVWWLAIPFSQIGPRCRSNPEGMGRTISARPL